MMIFAPKTAQNRNAAMTMTGNGREHVGVKFFEQGDGGGLYPVIFGGGVFGLAGGVAFFFRPDFARLRDRLEPCDCCGGVELVGMLARDQRYILIAAPVDNVNANAGYITRCAVLVAVKGGFPFGGAVKCRAIAVLFSLKPSSGAKRQI